MVEVLTLRYIACNLYFVQANYLLKKYIAIRLLLRTYRIRRRYNSTLPLVVDLLRAMLFVAVVAI